MGEGAVVAGRVVEGGGAGGGGDARVGSGDVVGEGEEGEEEGGEGEEGEESGVEEAVAGWGVGGFVGALGKFTVRNEHRWRAVGHLPIMRTLRSEIPASPLLCRCRRLASTVWPGGRRRGGRNSGIESWSRMSSRGELGRWCR